MSQPTGTLYSYEKFSYLLSIILYFKLMSQLNVHSSLSYYLLWLLFYREKIMTTPRKEKKREARREEKAEKAALLEKVIVNPNVIHTN